MRLGLIHLNRDVAVNRILVSIHLISFILITLCIAKQTKTKPKQLTSFLSFTRFILAPVPEEFRRQPRRPFRAVTFAFELLQIFGDDPKSSAGKRASPSGSDEIEATRRVWSDVRSRRTEEFIGKCRSRLRNTRFGIGITAGEGGVIK